MQFGIHKLSTDSTSLDSVFEKINFLKMLYLRKQGRVFRPGNKR